MTTYTIIRSSHLPGVRFVLEDANGDPVSLVGMTSARLAAAQYYDTPDVNLLINKELNVEGDPLDGVLSGAWTSEETDVTPGAYKAQVEVVYASASETVIFGPMVFVVLPSVTQH